MHYSIEIPKNIIYPCSIIFEIDEKKNSFLFESPKNLATEVDKINRKLGFLVEEEGEEIVNDEIGWYFDLNKKIESDKIEVFLMPITSHDRPYPEHPLVKQKIHEFITEFAEYLKKFEPLEMPKDESKSKFKPS